MGRINFRNPYEFDPYGVDGAGGLLGMLQAMMHQAQAEAASGLNPRVPGDGRPTAPQTPDYGPTPPTRFTVRPLDAYLPMDTETDAAENGLLDRLLALQAEQSRYQPTAENSGQMPSVPLDPNFRQLSRAPFAMQPQGAIGSFNRAEDQSSRPYSSVGGRAVDLPHTSQGDKAAQSDHSFSERVQSYWDHPHPYGLVSMLKGALNNIEQAVQGSIDATSVPSTEEDAFRQNQGRERGPIGAWNAVSLLAPMFPGGAGRILARPLAGTLRNGLPGLQAGQRIARQGTGEPIVNTSAPAVRLPSRNLNLRTQNVPVLANGMTAPEGFDAQHSMQAALPATGGLFGPYSEKGVSPWIVISPTITTVPVGWQGRALPIPPMGPMPLPPIPLPGFPNWWKAAWKALQLYPRISSGMGSGGGDDDDDCLEETRKAREICIDGFANDWKGDYDVGPYKTPSGKPWSIEDCMRGFKSPRCGGNPTDYKREPRPKRYSSRPRKRRSPPTSRSRRANAAETFMTA
jgi:hypothetical protein